ncbi:MAG: Nif3-like dinuclear metal center hexameric protein [Rubricoccaceae bacterium]
MHQVSDVVRALDAWAPPGQKADFDRVGLQVGDPSAPARGVVVALDLTPAVIDEAIERGAGMIVTHHPLLFKPLDRVTAGHPVGGLVLRLAQAGIAFYAIHTNLDAAWDGVSFALARQLGLDNIGLLAPLDGVMRKLTTYVPPSHADAVRDALAIAGAGEIGEYRACSFSTEGTGRFQPLASASPTIGTAGGEHETVQEVRIEAILPSWILRSAITAIRGAHPYEEPAIDVVDLNGLATRSGYGAIGTLAEPEPLYGFLGRVASSLGSGALRYVGDPSLTIQRVAVCGGSGMSFFPAAQRAGGDAYVTADITYHRFFEALGSDGCPEMALIDAGHYETEAITERLIADELTSTFPDLPVRVTSHRTSPMRTFVGG